MLEIFEKEKVVSVLMAVFFGVGLLLRILQGALYLAMIRETEEMATTQNRLLKQCKLKFANCYRLNDGVANIPVFVEKFLNRLRLGPLSFRTMYHLSGQSVLLSIVCAGIGVVRSIVEGRTLGEILPFYIVSFFGLYVYFSVSSVVDLRGKRQMLKVNLIDYLENHLSARMETTSEDMERLYGTRDEGENFNRQAGGRREQAGNSAASENRGRERAGCPAASENRGRERAGCPAASGDRGRAENLRTGILLPRRRETQAVVAREGEERASGGAAGLESGRRAGFVDAGRGIGGAAVSEALGQLTDQELDELLREFS